MNKLVSDGSVKKINYPVLYESGITPPLCEVSAPEPDAGGKRIVAYVYKSSRNTVFENPDIVKTCTVRDLKNDFSITFWDLSLIMRTIRSIWKFNVYLKNRVMFMVFLMNLYGGNDYGNKNFSSRLRTQSSKLG